MSHKVERDIDPLDGFEMIPRDNQRVGRITRDASVNLDSLLQPGEARDMFDFEARSEDTTKAQKIVKDEPQEGSIDNLLFESDSEEEAEDHSPVAEKLELDSQTGSFSGVEPDEIIISSPDSSGTGSLPASKLETESVKKKETKKAQEPEKASSKSAMPEVSQEQLDAGYDSDKVKLRYLQELGKSGRSKEDTIQMAHLEEVVRINDERKGAEIVDYFKEFSERTLVDLRKRYRDFEKSQVIAGLEEILAKEVKLNDDPGRAAMVGILARAENIVTSAHGLYMQAFKMSLIADDIWQRIVRAMNSRFECRSDNVATGKADEFFPELSELVSTIRRDYTIAKTLWDRIENYGRVISRQISAYQLEVPNPASAVAMFEELDRQDVVMPPQKNSVKIDEHNQHETSMYNVLSRKDIRSSSSIDDLLDEPEEENGNV